MRETFELYVKATSNCRTLSLQTFERLGPEWTGEDLRLPFGEGEKIRAYEVVGWTDLHGGSSCPVHVARVRWLPDLPDIGSRTGEQVGYLVWGGNSGLRVLDADAEPIPDVDDHLPPGHGWPIVWVSLVAAADLPPEVRAVVERHLCQSCGIELPLSTSPYSLDEGRSVYLCEDCARPEALEQ